VKKFLPAAVLTVLILFLVACGSRPSGTAPASGGPAASLVKDNQPAGQADRGPGDPASDTTGLAATSLLMTTRLPDLFGDVKPLAELKGKAGIMLAFVDTKCPFSNAAIREFPKVATVLETCGIASLLVNIGEPEANVKKTYVPDAPVVYDTSKTTQKKWNVRSVPTIVLMDSAGAVAYQGAAAWTAVAAATEKMLNLTAGSVLLNQAQSTIQG
jgi:hypothetical protein